MKSPRISPLNFQKLNIHGPKRVAGGALALALCAPLPRPAAAFKGTGAGADSRASVSRIRVICQYIGMTALNIMALIALILDFLEKPRKRLRAGETALASFLWMSDLAFAMVLASLVIYSEPTRGKRLFRVLSQLQQVNAKLGNASTKTAVKMIAVFGILACFIAFQVIYLYRILTGAIDEGRNWPILVMYSAYSIALTLGVLAALQWGFTVLAARSAAAAVNQNLQQLRYVNLKPEGPKPEDNQPKLVADCFTKSQREARPGSEYTASLSQLQTTIRDLALSHEQIGCVVKQMNKIDGAIVLVSLMATCLRLVATPYYVWNGLHANQEKVLVLVLSVCWPILHLLTLVVIVEPCHLTQKQRETTKFLLSRLMVHLAPRCKRLSEELDRFVTQIRLTDAKFMPLGVYVLTRPLIATILGGVITYLVMVLQFMSYKHNF